MLDAAGRQYAIRLRTQLRDALARVRLPGRFQRVGRFIFDVAHNPDGARRARAHAARQSAPTRPLVVVLCVLGDKDWRGDDARARHTVADHFVLTMAPTAPASRAWDRGRGARATRCREDGKRCSNRDFDDGAASTRRRLARRCSITGSFHTVGDAMARLQVSPLAG